MLARELAQPESDGCIGTKYRPWHQQGGWGVKRLRNGLDVKSQAGAKAHMNDKGRVMVTCIGKRTPCLQPM